jgi:hypothetical protein
MADRLPQRISLPLDPETALIGVFVPWNPKRKDSPGWTKDANGCDIWRGANVKGYGVVRVGPTRNYLVHRLRYEREIGPIPEGAELDHFVCDNGAGGCCNPHHCRPVAHRENLLRGNTVASIHAAKTHCPKNHPLSGDNLVRGSHGERKCRTCENSHSARARLRRKEATRV